MRFTSSGVVRNADYTMERLVRVVKDLRTVYRFNGYIHLKSIPGASQELVNEAGLYADRMSVNIEIPNEKSLQLLAPEKDFQSVFQPMRYIQQGVLQSAEERKRFRHAPRFVPAGQSTQMIVGATPDSDKDILRLSSALYQRPTMKRVYYSGFIPVNEYDNRLPALKQPPLVRENRLYQADWQLVACNEILGFLHHDTHLLQLPCPQTGISAGDDDQFRRLHPDTGYAKKHLVIRLIDIDWELLRMAQRPTELRIDFQIEVRIGIVHDLIHFELIEAQEPVRTINEVSPEVVRQILIRKAGRKSTDDRQLILQFKEES